MSASRISRESSKPIDVTHSVSTGPTTDQGKRAVRLNAVTHGLTARDVVINTGDCREDLDAFNEARTKFRQDLKPEGILEESLVDTIVESYWRVARARRFESGSIRLRGDAVSARINRRRFESCEAAIALHDTEALRRMSLGIEYLLEQIAFVRNEIKAGGLTKESSHWLVNFLAERLSLPAEVFDAEAPRQSLSSELQGQLLSALEGELQNLSAEVIEVRVREELAIQAHIASLAVPPREALDRLRRYEGPIFRELHRAISELRRCQDRRNANVNSAKQSHHPGGSWP